MELVRKLWGHEEVMVNEDLYCAKYLCLVKGHKCSVHYHRKKTETFVGVEGVTEVELFDWYEPEGVAAAQALGQQPVFLKERVTLKNNKTLTIPAGVPHRFSAVSRRAKLLEVSTHHDDEDVVRLEESW